MQGVRGSSPLSSTTRDPARNRFSPRRRRPNHRDHRRVVRWHDCGFEPVARHGGRRRPGQPDAPSAPEPRGRGWSSPSAWLRDHLRGCLKATW